MYLIELDDVGMAEDFKDADFPCDALYVRLFNDFLFLEGFNGDLLVS